ncbi:hypothetical protein [Haladaptatus sp. CMAA 1911]|uniref:hypothetical protein n=1 Tax=unclassified Haladaptatus TaxID=2622732 RepID=UPI00375500A2
MPLRKSALWMEQLDDRILEHLSEESWSSPSVMESMPEFRASKDRINERCRVLADAELVAIVVGDMVEITQWGMLYLDGGIDAEHQPCPTKRAFRGVTNSEIHVACDSPLR